MHVYTPYNSNFYRTNDHSSNIFNTQCASLWTWCQSPLEHTASILPKKGIYLDCRGGGSSWHCCTVTRLHWELNTAWHHLPVYTSR